MLTRQTISRVLWVCLLAATSLAVFLLLHRQFMGGPLMTVDDPEVLEGDSATTWLKFTVKLASPATRTVTVKYETDVGIPPDGADPGVDYEPTSGWLTIAPGESQKTVAVKIYPDTTPEGNETLFLNLSRATYATIDDSQGEGVILNDDGAIVWVDDIEVDEDVGSVTIPVEMDMAISSSVSIKYETISGSAASDVDYRASSGVVTFHPGGPTTKEIVVAILPDRDIEENETFQVKFTPASPNVEIAASDDIGKNLIAVTISNDDGPTISIESTGPATEGNTEIVKSVFIVRLSQPLDRDVIVDYELVSPKINYFSHRPTPKNIAAATIGEDVALDGDGHLRIPAGQVTGQIVVNILPDRTPEQREVFEVHLTKVRWAIDDATETTVPTLRANRRGVFRENALSNQLDFK